MTKSTIFLRRQKKMSKSQKNNGYHEGFGRCQQLLQHSRLGKPVYSKKFESRLLSYFGEYRNHKRFPEWWSDHAGGRIRHALSIFIPWLERQISLEGKTVLEVGCGTGSSTVALASVAKRVVAVDFHQASLHVLRQRLVEDGFDHKVDVVEVNCSLDKLNDLSAKFDVIVCYGVLEHMLPGERATGINQMWKLLKPQGHLVVYETPNRLYPFDYHTTQLWLWSWLPPPIALLYGKAFGRFKSTLNLSGMYREGYGYTFYEIKKLFISKRYFFLDQLHHESGLRRFIAGILMATFHIPRWAMARNLNFVIKKEG